MDQLDAYPALPLLGEPGIGKSVDLTQEHERVSAANVERQQPRSYHIERIQGATMMSRGFTRNFQTELTPSGPLAAPYLPRASDTVTRQPQATHRSTANAWPKTAYLCRRPICHERFEHTSMPWDASGAQEPVQPPLPRSPRHKSGDEVTDRASLGEGSHHGRGSKGQAGGQTILKVRQGIPDIPPPDLLAEASRETRLLGYDAAFESPYRI